MQPHQQRVIEEKAELDERLSKLKAFAGTEEFASLSEAERARLNCQGLFMAGYSAVLGERIAAFSQAADESIHLVWMPDGWTAHLRCKDCGALGGDRPTGRVWSLVTPRSKRYTASDIDELKWATDIASRLDDNIKVWARMKDGSEVRCSFCSVHLCCSHLT